MNTIATFPCAVNLGSDTAKQAALSPTPLGGEQGVSPLSVCTDRGALGSYGHDAIRWPVALALTAIILAVLVFTPAACWKP